MINFFISKTSNLFNKYPKEIFILIILLGIILRLLAARLPYNFDVESYRIVADIVNNGGNVYAETLRYNYGPIWFSILGVLDIFSPIFSSDPTWGLRFSVNLLLILVDLGIMFVLWRWWGRKVASLFFINPVSILITGYHGQFDNLAILISLIGVWLLNKEIEKKNLSGKKLIGLLIIGISLMTKHLLFVFPFWLALKQPKLRYKIPVLTIPLAIFGLGFLPFWAQGSEGIIQNVFLYKSHNNAPFWQTFAPDVILNNVPLIILFAGSLAVAGFIFYKKELREQILTYYILLVIFASAIANQYLAIVVPYIALNPNIFFAIYSVFVPIFISGESVQKILPKDIFGYKAQIALLTFGFLYVYMYKEFWKLAKSFFSWSKKEIMHQIEL